MKTKLILVAICGFCIFAASGAAHAPWKHKIPLEAPLLHYITFERALTDHARADRCLTPLERVYEPAWRVPPDNRPANVRKEKRRYARAQDAESRCEAAVALAWYNGSPGPACVHSKEGGWRANTGNGYYGGWQADLSFQRAYGAEFFRRKGTANNWTPLEQIIMAHRGWLARGWYPWPNTARACGLI